MTPCPLSAPSLPPPGQVGGASALASALSQHHCPLISMMINLLLPGFLTKGLPRLTLLLTTPQLSSYSDSHHTTLPSPSRPSPSSSLHSSGKGQEMLDLRIREKQGPRKPAHLGSITSALTGVNSTLQLPFATRNLGKCAMVTLCSERVVSPLQNPDSLAAKAKANSPAVGALQGLSNVLWGFQGP